VRAFFWSILRCAFALLLGGTVAAQPLNPAKDLSQYNLDHWADDQIPSGILQIIQTRDGYLWMATLSGLVRFDGVKTKLFNKFNTPVLGTNAFKSIYEDRHKNFWAGSNGSGLLLMQKKSFKKFTVPFGTSSNNIEHIIADSKDNLWLCTVKGLVLFKDSVFTLISPPGLPKETEYTAFDAAEDKNGNLWVATSIGVFQYSNGELKEHAWSGTPLSGRITAIQVDANQDIWIGSYGNGVYRVTNNVIEKVKELISIARPVVIMEDRNHAIWIGSENGIVRYNQDGVSYLDANSGLSNGHVTSFCEDHEGSVWMGTYYGGLNRLRDGAFTNFTETNGLPHSTIHCIFQAKDSTVWIGTESNVAQFKNGVFTKLSLPQLMNARVRDIRSDSENNLWIATYEGLFGYKNKKLKKYTVTDGLANEQVRVIFEDNQKTLWIGTRNGLNTFNDGKWKTYSEKDGLLSGIIMSIIQLRDGTIVVGTNGGLYQLNNNRFEPLQPENGKISTTTFRMYEDEEGYLWIGTANGLVCIKNKTLYSFASDNQLLAGAIYQVLEDQDGMLWLTSNVGIIRIPKKDLIEHTRSSTAILNPQLFDKSSGLRTSEVTATSNAMIALDKKIWFPTIEGISVIDPANILMNKVPPPIVIESVLVSGKELDATGKIIIEPGSRNIEIHYSALSYMIPKKVQYKYKLEGYDNEWHEVGDRRTAFYTSLPPGEYSFTLAASNNDSVWKTEENVLDFHVEKAFWQTWLFYVLVAFAMAVLIIGVDNYRIRRIRKLNLTLDQRILERTREVMLQKEEIESQRDYIESKNIELETARNVIAEQYEKVQEKVNARTLELQKANEELDYFVYKSSHDIKGPLARLQGLCNLAIMEAKESSSKEYLVILQKESILANRVIQKLSHAHQIKNMDVEIGQVNLNELLFEIINQLNALNSDAAPVKFIIDVDKNITLNSDTRLLKELFLNLLENSIVFKSEKDQFVKIHATVHNDRIVISIVDNGVGIDVAAQTQIFKMFYKGSEKSVGLGLGLYITKKAIEKLHGSVELKNTGSGETEFEVMLPKSLNVT
jgi:ligand-binding sensor domain-containing protein/signal transduction histidine kinase